MPDPQDPATFERSKLDWSELESERGRRMLAVYRDLARLRREHPELTDPSFAHVACPADEAARFFTMERGRAAGPGELRRPADGRRGR